MKEFTIEADNSGFYPANIAVNIGDVVRITFAVRPMDVNYNGLEIRSDVFGTGQILPGQATTVEFTARRGFQFVAYDNEEIVAIGQVSVI